MIFKLDGNQRSNICCEEEGELIISQTGVFNVADYVRQFLRRERIRQMAQNCPSEHFISRHFLTAVNQGGRTEKRIFYFDENGEKLKKTEKFLVLTFPR